MAKHYYTEGGGSGQVVSDLVRMILDQRTNNNSGGRKQRDSISEVIHSLKTLKKIGILPDEEKKKKEEEEKNKLKGEWIFKPEQKKPTFTLRESLAMSMLFGPFIGLGYLFIINAALNAIK